METTFAGEVDGHIHRNFDYDILGALQREASLTVFFTQFARGLRPPPPHAWVTCS